MLLKGNISFFIRASPTHPWIRRILAEPCSKLFPSCITHWSWKQCQPARGRHGSKSTSPLWSSGGHSFPKCGTLVHFETLGSWREEPSALLSVCLAKHARDPSTTAALLMDLYFVPRQGYPSSHPSIPFHNTSCHSHCLSYHCCLIGASELWDGTLQQNLSLIFHIFFLIIPWADDNTGVSVPSSFCGLLCWASGVRSFWFCFYLDFI